MMLGQRILAVTEQASEASRYEFLLTDLRLPYGAIGMSVGARRIYVDAWFAEQNYLAVAGTGKLPVLLAMVVAHEIGHDIAGHAVTQQTIGSVTKNVHATGSAISHLPVIGFAGSAISWLAYGASAAAVYLYGREQELEADRKAIGYWKALGFPCRVWVERFQALAAKGVKGDFRHPTDGRLAQAGRLCELPVRLPANQ